MRKISSESMKSPQQSTRFIRLKSDSWVLGSTCFGDGTKIEIGEDGLGIDRDTQWGAESDMVW